MPRVQYNDPNSFESVTKSFPEPKNQNSGIAWLQEIRKVIPQVPDINNTDWYIHKFEALPNTQWLSIVLHNSVGEMQFMTVDKYYNALAA